MTVPGDGMFVTLPQDLDRYVREKVAEGRFADASEYIGHLVEARRGAEQAREADLQSLETALRDGIADADSGRVVPLAEAFARVRSAVAVSRADSEA